MKALAPQLRVGSALMRPIFELDEMRMGFTAFLNDTTPEEILAQSGPLIPDFIDATSCDCRLSQHAWLIECHGKRIVVDPCVGVRRHRPALSFYHMISSPLLENFAALGVTLESVDYVFCTHLHLDHVGWNTRLKDGHYVPTFPNARYLFSPAEEAYWRRDLAGELSTEDAYFNGGVSAECILPVREAGLVDTVRPGTMIADCLTALDAAGHTIGHLAAVLESGGEGAVLAGDAIHHPLQIVFHDRLTHEYDPMQARATRLMLLALCETRDYWLAPAHFRAPHFCKIARKMGRYYPVWPQ